MLTANDNPRGVAQAVLLSLAGITDDQRGVCVAVMDLISVLSAAGVPRVIVQAAGRAGMLPGVDGPVEEARVDAALGLLADWSLLTFSVDRSAVIAHRLVMRVVRERRIASGTFAQVVMAAGRALKRLASAVERVWEDPMQARELAAQIAALGEHTGQGPDSGQASDVLTLRVRGLHLLNGLGDSPGQVIRLGVPLANDCQQVLGSDHPDTMTARSSLASAYRKAGRLNMAIPLYKRTLADWQRVLGDDHPDTLTARNNLASAYREAGHLDVAIPLYERTLADRHRVLGDDHPDTLTSRNNLASAYREAGHLEVAIPMLEKVLADRLRVLGDGHPGTLTSRNNLAFAYREAGRLDVAIRLLEKALATAGRVVGRDHPTTLGARIHLAYAYGEAGRLDVAIPLLEEILAAAVQVLGGDHPTTLTARNNLAGAYHEAGKLDKAIPLYERTLADRQRVLGEDHPATVISGINLAYAYRGEGRVRARHSRLG